MKLLPRTPTKPRLDRAAAPAAPAQLSAPRPWLNALFVLALTAAVFLAYRPAWQGTAVWDDDKQITAPQLQSWQGLEQIWAQPGATEQYYPLLHSAFWLEHRIWGDNTFGYHLLNIVLHMLGAVLVWLILRRLKVPGAYLAAAIFALHPIQVESVAWITEQKNTLSTVFYLVTMLTYLRFDRTRGKAAYALALLLFVCAVLSKTVTVTLPAALLVIFWWKRGRLSWKTDVLPVLPFFVLGTATGLLTAWIERRIVGAEGAAFSLTPIERVLIAGRAIWFYLTKLFWPLDLVFVYPRWHISQGAWWQYLFPTALVGLLLALWALRRRSRAPLAAALFFVGTLLPLVGFFNAYLFLYTFVADHFQYLACLGVIALASAGIALGLQRLHLWRRPAGYGLCLMLLATLATLTWRQCRMYANAKTLYQMTIDANPACFLAHNNLGLILANQGQLDQAIFHYRKALESKPDYALAHNNLGAALGRRGRVEEAIAQYRRALEIAPAYAEARYNLALALAGRGQVDEAIDQYQKVLEVRPNFAEAHNNLGSLLARRGRVDEAIAQFQRALEIQPDWAEAHYNLGIVLADRGQIDEAIAQYQKVLELRPDYAEAHDNLGVALARRGRVDEAIAHFQKALEIKPDFAPAHYNLANALLGRGQIDEGITHLREALEIKPDYAEAHYNLGVALWQKGRTAEAIAHFQQALEIKPDFAAARRNLEALRAQQR